MKQLRILTIALPIMLSGCCYLFPCHPSTYVIGTVLDGDSGQAIVGASIHLYSYEASSKSSGCFSLGGADSLPFKLTISAPGYKPISTKPKAGTFSASILLFREGSNKSSSAQLKEISDEKFTAYP